MKQSGLGPIAARYVSALFEVATKASAVAAVEKDLSDLARATHGNEGFARLLTSPLLTRASQEKLMSALADSFGAHQVTKAFLVTLAHARRLPALIECAVQFARLAEEARGEMTADIVTATAISKDEEAQAEQRLSKIYGKKVKLRSTQDANLLGGVIVKIGGMQLDASLAGKLARMEQNLKAA